MGNMQLVSEWLEGYNYKGSTVEYVSLGERVYISPTVLSADLSLGEECRHGIIAVDQLSERLGLDLCEKISEQQFLDIADELVQTLFFEKRISAFQPYYLS